MMIDKAIESEVASAEFPEKIIIFTDMQFDEATCSQGKEMDMVENLDRLFDTSPYSRPQIVCWNLRPTGNVAATCKTEGVALVSGFSKDTFKNILNGTTFTPYDVMRRAIDDARYSRLQL